MNIKDTSTAQERLLSLYLRLNGYFVSGLIVHSPETGKNLTEIDVLGVRFPHNRQPERQVGPDPLLEPSSEMIDLVICEVKGGSKQPRFNDSLLATATQLGSALRWAGMYSEGEINDLAPKLVKAFTPTPTAQPIIPTVIGPRGTRVRGLMCCPDRDAPRHNQPWFIHGAAMLTYISRCLCPLVKRDTCSTTYDFGLWQEHEPIVRYFKGRSPESVWTMTDLYAYLANPVIE